MIKTKNGNNQKSYEELKEEVRKVSNKIDDESCRETYKELTYYLIRTIEEMTPGHYDWAYNTAVKYIKKEYRNRFKVLYVDLAYDAKPDSFIPQDNPYKLILIDTEDGEVITTDSLYRKLRQKKGE